MDSAAQKGFSVDVKSYGLKQAGKVLEMVSQFVHEQGLTNRRIKLEEIFAPCTLAL